MNCSSLSAFSSAKIFRTETNSDLAFPGSHLPNVRETLCDVSQSSSSLPRMFLCIHIIRIRCSTRLYYLTYGKSSIVFELGLLETRLSARTDQLINLVHPVIQILSCECSCRFQNTGKERCLFFPVSCCSDILQTFTIANGTIDLIHSNLMEETCI